MSRTNTAATASFRYWPIVEDLEARVVPATPALPTQPDFSSAAETRSDNEQFVNRLYQDLLFRNAEPTGLAHWSNLLDQGVSRRGIALGILASTEQLHHAVDQLYRATVHRSATLVELDTGSAALLRGIRFEQLQAQVLGSEEYYQTRSGGSSLGFLKAVYRDLFDRDLDAGVAPLALRLVRGASRAGIVNELVNGPEAAATHVEKAYERFLNRPADAAGLEHHLRLLQQSGRREVVTLSLLSSPEYARTTDNYGAWAEYVTAVYDVLLDRDPTPGELQDWVIQLEGGQTSPNSFAQQLEGTTEFLADVVASFYRHILQRPPDDNGLQYFVNYLSNGGTFEQVQAQMASSQEFIVNIGGNTIPGYLNALFEVALNRPVDAQALTVFGSALANGTATPLQVATAVYTSQEYFTDLVEGYYLAFLDRPADPQGLAVFVNALLTGGTDQEVVAAILSSTEFYNDVTGN